MFGSELKRFTIVWVKMMLVVLFALSRGAENLTASNDVISILTDIFSFIGNGTSTYKYLNKHFNMSKETYDSITSNFEDLADKSLQDYLKKHAGESFYNLLTSVLSKFLQTQNTLIWNGTEEETIQAKNILMLLLANFDVFDGLASFLNVNYYNFKSLIQLMANKLEVVTAGDVANTLDLDFSYAFALNEKITAPFQPDSTMKFHEYIGNFDKLLMDSFDGFLSSVLIVWTRFSLRNLSYFLLEGIRFGLIFAFSIGGIVTNLFTQFVSSISHCYDLQAKSYPDRITSLTRFCNEALDNALFRKIIYDYQLPVETIRDYLEKFSTTGLPVNYILFELTRRPEEDLAAFFNAAIDILNSSKAMISSFSTAFPDNPFIPLIMNVSKLLGNEKTKMDTLFNVLSQTLTYIDIAGGYNYTKTMFKEFYKAPIVNYSVFSESRKKNISDSLVKIRDISKTASSDIFIHTVADIIGINSFILYYLVLVPYLIPKAEEIVKKNYEYDILPEILTYTKIDLVPELTIYRKLIPQIKHELLIGKKFIAANAYESLNVILTNISKIIEDDQVTLRDIIDNSPPIIGRIIKGAVRLINLTALSHQQSISTVDILQNPDYLDIPKTFVNFQETFDDLKAIDPKTITLRQFMKSFHYNQPSDFSIWDIIPFDVIVDSLADIGERFDDKSLTVYYVLNTILGISTTSIAHFAEELGKTTFDPSYSTAEFIRKLNGYNVTEYMTPLITIVQHARDDVLTTNDIQDYANIFTPKEHEDEDKLGGGAIAGIIAGCLMFIIIIFGGVMYCCHMKAKKDSEYNSIPILQTQDFPSQTDQYTQ